MKPETAGEREALKPCPFCGGAAVPDANDERVRIRCMECGAEGGLHFFGQDELESDDFTRTETKAETAWNLRAQAGQPPERAP